MPFPSFPRAPRALAGFFLLLLLAAGLQTTLAPRLLLLGGQPDFVFAVAIAAALLADAGVGALAGFAAGLITAALIGDTVGTLIVSQTLAGFAAGALGARLFRTNLVVVLAGALAVSLLAHAAYALSAPAVFARGGGAGGVLTAAVGNALIALPVALLLRRLGWGPERESS
jgi:rod shape-determining protein MreD